MKSLFHIIGIPIVLLCLPLFLHAQIANPSNPNDSMSLSAEPQYPNIHEDVTVSISGYSTDLNAATIIWTVNDKEVLKGIGKKEITINSGQMGTFTRVSATVIPTKGLPNIKTIVISPSFVNILWEATTYTPPFYAGKSLFTPQSNITVVAIPQFSGQNESTAPESLIYRWTLNDYIMEDQSGYGKQSVTFAGNYWGRDERLSVAITSRNSSFVTEKSFTIHPTNPLVLMYEDNPLLGLLTNHAITSDFSLQTGSTEASFFAAPYFFQSNLLTRDGTIYDWSMNGGSVPNNNGNSITFRNDSHSSGTSNVHVDISQQDMTYETGSTGFSIHFK